MREIFGEAPVLETEEVRVLRENIWVPSRLWKVNLVLDTSSLEVTEAAVICLHLMWLFIPGKHSGFTRAGCG